MQIVTVLRITRHPLQPEQEAALRSLYPRAKLKILNYAGTVTGVEDLQQLIHDLKPDVIEAVLPLNLLAGLLSVVGDSIPVLRAVMKRELDGDQARFTFSHYERVHRVHVLTEPLTPVKG